MRGKFLASAGLAAAMVLSSPAAHATLLLSSCLNAEGPGGTAVNKDDGCATDLNTLGGSASQGRHDERWRDTFKAGAARGKFEEAVFREPIGGTLDFLLQFKVGGSRGAPKTVSVSDLAASGFAGFLTSIGTVSPDGLLGTGTFGPSVDSRSGTGNTVTWTFLNPVRPGDTSFTMIVATNATSYQACTKCIDVETSDGGHALVDGFEPAGVGISPVP